MYTYFDPNKPEHKTRALEWLQEFPLKERLETTLEAHKGDGGAFGAIAELAEELGTFQMRNMPTDPEKEHLTLVLMNLEWQIVCLVAHIQSQPGSA